MMGRSDEEGARIEEEKEVMRRKEGQCVGKKEARETYLDGDLVLLLLGLISDNSLGSLGSGGGLGDLLLDLTLRGSGSIVNLCSYLGISVSGTSLGVGSGWLLLDLFISIDHGDGLKETYGSNDGRLGRSS